VWDVDKFDAIKILVASPEDIQKWSFGEVKKPETINYRTHKPERDGLFCEVIFGPTRDYTCSCGKYKSIRYKGIKCERCNVEITESKVRRERMGLIDLAAYVAHVWYSKGTPSYIALLLDISPKDLEKVLYFNSYIVINPGNLPLNEKQLLTEKEYRQYFDKYGNLFEARMGAEAIHELLEKISIPKLVSDLKSKLQEKSSLKKHNIIKRLEVAETFFKSGCKPEWMIMKYVPVIPPDLRPMVQLDGGRFATSDLNDLYRRVINRNNRLKKLIDMGAPEIIIKNEKRMLQEAVNSLIDNGRRGRPVTGPGKRPLKSLNDMLKGKQGRFRQNLLGKRVDYSGRSVIVIGPNLKLHQCGLPKKMALELFKPFIMNKLVTKGLAHNIKSAKKMLERGKAEIWDLLDEVVRDHPVLLNRAPTLHRLGIQAFEPILVEGKAIQIPPLVCTAFNADFDGDQMAVHVPLLIEAQTEARMLILSAHNLFSPASGMPIMNPTHDMTLGCYYLTRLLRNNPTKTIKEFYCETSKRSFSIEDQILAPGQKFNYKLADDIFEEKTGKLLIKKHTAINNFVMSRINEIGLKEVKVLVHKIFSSAEEAIHAYEQGQVSLHTEHIVRINGKFYETSVGRLIFNQLLPGELGFINKQINKNSLSGIVSSTYKVCNLARTAKLLDDAKELGFKFATTSGLSFSISDLIIPNRKVDILSAAERKSDDSSKKFKVGAITREEKRQNDIDVWQSATAEVTDEMIHEFQRRDEDGEFNSVYMMAISGARGSMQQVRQLCGMRGLMSNPQGDVIDYPIKSNFRDGLTLTEYFISTYGARKGLVDTALRTADSGYLTRRLVDVAQDVIIREKDCGSTEGIFMVPMREKRKVNNLIANEILISLTDRIRGRMAIIDVFHPETGELLVKAGEEITSDIARKIEYATIVIELDSPDYEKALGKFTTENVIDDKTDKIILKSDCMIDNVELEHLMSCRIKRVKVRPAVLVRSPLTCKSKLGICQKCYGNDLSTGRIIELGETSGIIAAQSIGEPGTQLTMRTFHIGGIAIAQKVEVRSNTEGEISVDGLKWTYKVDRKKQLIGNVDSLDEKEAPDLEEDLRRIVLEGFITITKKDGSKENYHLPVGAFLNQKIANGERIGVGDVLCEYNPNQVVTQYAGKVKFNNLLVKDGIVVSNDGTIIIEKTQKEGGFGLETYKIPLGSYLRANEGDMVEPGFILAEKIAEQKAAIAGINGQVEFFDIKIKNQKVISDNGIIFISPFDEKESVREKKYVLPQGVKEFKEESNAKYGVELKVRSGNEVKKNEELLVISSEIDGEVSIKNKMIHVKRDARKEYLFPADIPFVVNKVNDKSNTITFVSDTAGLARVVQPKGSAAKTLDTRRIIVTDEEEHEIPQDANLLLSKLRVKPGSNIEAGEKICDEIHFKSAIDGEVEITSETRTIADSEGYEIGVIDRPRVQKRTENYNKIVIRDIKDLTIKDIAGSLKEKIVDKILASPIIEVGTKELIAQANEKISVELADKLLKVSTIGGYVKIENDMPLVNLDVQSLNKFMGKKITRDVKNKKTKTVAFKEGTLIDNKTIVDIDKLNTDLSTIYVECLRVKVENEIVVAIRDTAAIRERLLGKKAKQDVIAPESKELICQANTIITEDIRDKILADHTIKRIELIDYKIFDIPENATVRVKEGMQIKAGAELVFPTHIEGIRIINNVDEYEIPQNINLSVNTGDIVKANEDLCEPIGAIVSKIPGKVNYITKYSKKVNNEVVRKVIIYSGKEYEVPEGLQIKVKNGDTISVNSPLTEPIEFEGNVTDTEDKHHKRFVKPEKSEKKYKITADMRILVNDGMNVREGDKLAALVNDKFNPVRTYSEKITISGKNIAQFRYYPVISESLVVKINGKSLNFSKDVDLSKLKLDNINEIIGTRVSKTIMNNLDGTCVIESEHVIDQSTAKFMVMNAANLSEHKLKLYLPGISVNFTLGEIHFEKRTAEEIEVHYDYEVAGVIKLIKRQDKEGKERTTIGSIIVQMGEAHQILDGAELKVEDGHKVNVGEILAKWGSSSKKTIDIIQGLPRVAELFEARRPKKESIIAEFDGVAKRAGNSLIIESFSGERKQYKSQFGTLSNFLVFDGELVKAGDQLTEGNIAPKKLRKIAGVERTMRYIIDEIQHVYKNQGVKINDKHIEVIVRQMFRKIKILNSGDTRFLPREIVTLNEFYIENERAGQLRIRTAEGEQILQGITKASLTTDSFISAASFQETTRVLTQASIRGKVDYLRGLKENLIIGKLIPAGTGISAYRNITLPDFARKTEVKAAGAPLAIKAEELKEVMEEENMINSKDKELDIMTGGEGMEDDGANE
jgi:DNA-directed RNA polymerase subunit beta'